MSKKELRVFRARLSLLTLLAVVLLPASPAFAAPGFFPIDFPSLPSLNLPNVNPAPAQTDENIQEEPPVVSQGEVSQESGQVSLSNSQPGLPGDCPGSISNYNVIIGTDSSETLYGTDGADFIWGGGGNNIIYAFGGNDCVDAGDGNDIVHAGAGGDVVLGGEGNDILNGNEGDDLIRGAEGNDIIDGGPNFDTCFGGSGNNIINNCEAGDVEGPGGGDGDGEEPPSEPEPAAISGMKFNDANGDGIKESSETGLAGWTINLSGNATTSTTTDSAGNYLFQSLAAGDYRVCETLAAGWAQTSPATTTAGTVMCDNGTVGYEVELSADEITTSTNFGNVQTATTTPPSDGTSAGGGGSSGGSGGGGGSGTGQAGVSFAAACVPSQGTIGIGQNIVFAAGEAGGAAPVTFTWSGDISGTGLTRLVSFWSLGVKSVSVTATDTLGRTAVGNCSVTVLAAAPVTPGLGGAPGEIDLGPTAGPAEGVTPSEAEEKPTTTAEETTKAAGGFLAALTQASLGTILLWILIALILLGIILFFFMWRRREREQKPGRPKGPPSTGSPPVIPLE